MLLPATVNLKSIVSAWFVAINLSKCAFNKSLPSVELDTVPKLPSGFKVLSINVYVIPESLSA